MKADTDGDDGLGRGLLLLSLLATEAWLEERGWDAPPLVMVLRAAEPYEILDGVAATGALALGRDLTYEVVGEGDPYEILDGFDPTGALALVVAVESWAWPLDLPEAERVGRPSEHPDRVELRSVTAVTVDHDVLSVVRPRGDEPFVDEVGGGRLLEALEAAMTP